MYHGSIICRYAAYFSVAADEMWTASGSQGHLKGWLSDSR